jgi:hypothetical protein
VGYDSAAVQRRAALLLSALLLPIALAFWLRRRALNAEVPDKPCVWFSYIRCQQWLLNGSLVAWWASTETLQWSKWSEKWLTHRSTLRRAQAIAKKAKIPVERIPEIAQTAGQQDSHYAIPPSAIAGNKLHSSTKKMSDVRWITFTMLGAKLLIPTAFALLVKFVPMSPSSDRIPYLAGAIVTLAAYLLLFNVISTRRLRSNPDAEVKAAKRRCAGRGLMAAGVAVVAGLRFHLQQLLADPNGFASHPQAPGSGWYVVLVAVTIRLIQYLPFFSYKEVPVVQASLPGSRARRAASSDTAEPKREAKPAMR